MNARVHVIPAVAAAILLFVALGDHPYGFYTFLRWAVTIAALVVAWVAWSSTAQWATWLFVGIAILFNPIAPVYLDRETWQPIDVAVAVCFLGSLALKPRQAPPAPCETAAAAFGRRSTRASPGPGMEPQSNNYLQAHEAEGNCGRRSPGFYE